MNDADDVGAAGRIIPVEQRNWAVGAYVLHLLGAVIALPSIIGLVLNYVFRDGVTPVVRTHHAWMIRTFWWALALTAITWILWITLIGIPLALLMGFGIWVWWMYRHIRGLMRLMDALGMPD